MSSADLFRVLRRLASQNFVLKVIALVLALAAWWFVAGESKVLVSFTVPLEIRNVPTGLTIMNKPEREVEVRLTGPSSLLSGMRPSEISAGVDLAAARAGRQFFTIDDRLVRVPPGIKVQRTFPSSIEVVLERTERRAVPVAVRVGGGAAVRRRVVKVEVDPPSMTIEALPEEFSRMPVVHTEEVAPERPEGVQTAIARVETREPHARIVGDPNVRVKIHFRK